MSNPLIDKYNELYGKPKEDVVDHKDFGFTNDSLAKSKNLVNEIMLGPSTTLGLGTVFSGWSTSSTVTAPISTPLTTASSLSQHLKIEGYFKTNNEDFLIIDGLYYKLDITQMSSDGLSRTLTINAFATF